MFKSLLPYIIPTATGIAGWAFTFFYFRKERKNDLEYKLLKQIVDLSNKYLDLNKKYIALHGELCKLKQQNIELLDIINKINPSITENK